MRVIKEQGDYLKRIVRQSFLIALASAFALVLMLAYTVYVQANLLIMLFALAALLVSVFSYRRGLSYLSGLGGEKTVIKVLSKLGDEYALLNDLMLRDRSGNVDHVVLGPNGVFVIETKNYRGRIFCYGDKWYRQSGNGKTPLPGSPSNQAKSNAMRIKKILAASVADSRGVWVDAVVVFSNKHVNLHLHSAQVPVMRVRELPEYIATRRFGDFSPQEIDLMGKTILEHAQ
jgi:hypothetical protein